MSQPDASGDHAHERGPRSLPAIRRQHRHTTHDERDTSATDDDAKRWGTANRARTIDHLALAVATGTIDPRQASVAGSLLGTADAMLAREHMVLSRTGRGDSQPARRPPDSPRSEPDRVPSSPPPAAPTDRVIRRETIDAILDVFLEHAPHMIHLIEPLLDEPQLAKVAAFYCHGRAAWEREQTRENAAGSGPAEEAG